LLTGFPSSWFGLVCKFSHGEKISVSGRLERFYIKNNFYSKNAPRYWSWFGLVWKFNNGEIRSQSYVF
jgi:hypothetical protein